MNKVTKSALLTVATLFGGLLVGLVVGDVVFRLIPGSSVEDVKIGHALVAALVGGGCWASCWASRPTAAEKCTENRSHKQS